MNLKRGLALLLLALTLFSFLPAAAAAELEPEEESAIVPGLAKAEDVLHHGSKVYLGRDETGSLLWRVVLDETNTGSADGRLMISDDLMGGTMVWEDAKSDVASVYDRCFLPGEQAAILLTNKTDAYYIAKNSYHFAVTELTDAHTFLLSAEEADNYFIDDEDRKPGYWWLRNLFGGHWDYAGIVYYFGYIADQNIFYGGGFSTRPAFNLDLAPVLFVSAAEGGKAADADGTFSPISSGAEPFWKLTLLGDASRSAFQVSPSAGTLRATENYDVWRLAFFYTGAPVGEGECISAVLLSETGDPLYYASFPSKSSGFITLTFPEGLPAGSYTLQLFSERQSGTVDPDFASSPTAFTLTVNAA